MTGNAKKLTQLRRQEQEVRGYSASSRWYTALSNAMSFLERAETDSDHLDRFRDAWSAAYNLFMVHGKPGDDEFKRFNRWTTSLQEVPEVRNLCQENGRFKQFRANILKAKKILLWDTEKNQWREGYGIVDQWEKRSKAGPDKRIRWFLLIIRDVRNALSHPRFNPKSAAVRRTLEFGADCLIPVVAAATRAMIEYPVEGTTGRTTAYRSFLWPFLKNMDSFFSDYYMERLFPEEELSAFAEDDTKLELKDLAMELESRKSDLITGDAEETKRNWCVPVLFPTLQMQVNGSIRIVAQDDVFEPAYVLKSGNGTRKAVKKEYQGKEAGKELACLIWVLPWRSSLDAISTDPAFDSLPIMEIAHRALSRSDVPWAMLTNGREWRLLSKRTAHKPRCFLEVNLEAIADRRADAEGLLAFRYLLGLFSGPSLIDQDKEGRTLLERVLIGSDRHGKEIGDELKQNVFRALEELGDGFLHYLRTNRDDVEVLRKEKAPSLLMDDFLKSETLLNEIYHESLSLMYRLLFLFYAESRNLLPMDDEMYRESYSLESIRDDIISVHDDPDPKRFFGRGDSNLWERLKELFDFVNDGWRKVIPAYNGALFDPLHHKFLEQCKVPDYFLAQAIDLLSRTQPLSGQRRGEGRKKVTYRDLDIRHLGSIYEGILEYFPRIAEQNVVVMKRGSGVRSYEEYVNATDLKSNEKQQLKAWREAKEENPENPKLPRGCKVADFKDKNRYFLVYGGRESKRKSSGSYYTPDRIVQFMVKSTLGPIVKGDSRPKYENTWEEPKRLDTKPVRDPARTLSSEEILEIKVLDPAMGSGHFLVAATEYLARAYGEALIREKKHDKDSMSDEDFTRFKRMVAERCIYGVDVNPMAVELAKLSMWLFTMDKDRPLSFLDHHFKCGNSLLGAWISNLGELPRFGANGRQKKSGRYEKQINLFEQQFRAKIPVMVRDLLEIMTQETLTYDDIQAKKALDRAVEEIKKPFKNVADAWLGTFFGEGAKDYYSLLSDVDCARNRNSIVVEEQQFFHWELEFPELFFNESGQRISNSGVSLCITNPPYGLISQRESIQFLQSTYEIAEYQLDSYPLFFELAWRLVQEGAQLSLITPNAWTINEKSSKLRSFLLEKNTLMEFCHCSSNTFEGVTLEPLITKLKKKEPTDNQKVSVIIAPHNNDFSHADCYEVTIRNLSSKDIANYFFDDTDHDLLEKLDESLIPLAEYFDVTVGVKPYQVGKGNPRQTRSDVQNRVFDKDRREDERCRLYVRGSDFDRFQWSNEGQDRWIRYGPWLAEPRDSRIFDLKEKIIIRQTGDQIVGVIDRASKVCLNNCHTLSHRPGVSAYPLESALAQLNSSLADFIFLFLNPERGEAFAEVKANKVKKIGLINLKKLSRILPNNLAVGDLNRETLAYEFQRLVREAENRRKDATEIMQAIDQILEFILGVEIRQRRKIIERRILKPKGKQTED